MTTFDDNDIIAAIATPPGESAIAMVRASGKGVYELVQRIFQCQGAPLCERPPNTIVHGYITDQGVHIDEVVLLLMRAPNSYTGEDNIEISCHGGIIHTKRILRLLIEQGARLAEPGEFTKRAFLSGKLDLIQAEAVADIISAQTERAANSAIQQLEGNLSQQFDQLYEALIRVAADIEATLDFPEDELPDTVLPDIKAALNKVHGQTHALLSTWDEGQLLRNGVTVVISGKPNVGKSTLMNALLKTDRAIISSHPGTTRDTIEETLILDGFPVTLVDTAGLRETVCEVEQEGIRRTKRHVNMADILLYLIDAQMLIDREDENNVKGHPVDKTIIVLNKMDLGCSVNMDLLNGYTVIKSQLNQGLGIDDICKAIATIIEKGIDLKAGPHATISERHRHLLLNVASEIAEAIDMLKKDDEALLALIASRLRVAIENIGEALGKEYHESLLDAVFSTFCVGK